MLTLNEIKKEFLLEDLKNNNEYSYILFSKKVSGRFLQWEYIGVLGYKEQLDTWEFAFTTESNEVFKDIDSIKALKRAIESDSERAQLKYHPDCFAPSQCFDFNDILNRRKYMILNYIFKDIFKLRIKYLEKYSLNTIQLEVPWGGIILGQWNKIDKNIKLGLDPLKGAFKYDESYEGNESIEDFIKSYCLILENTIIELLTNIKVSIEKRIENNSKKFKETFLQ